MLSAIIRRLFDIPRRTTLCMPAPRTARLGRDVFEFEDRLVPATASFNAGVLVIATGLATDNDTVTIVAAGANGDGSTGVTATYSTAGGLVTQTFGGAGNPVTNIALDLRGGNDTVNVASLTATTVLVGEWDGNNSITLGATRYGGLIAGSGQNVVSIGGGSQNVWSSTFLPGFTAGTGVCLGWRYSFMNGFKDIGTNGSPVGNANANVINTNTEAGQRSLLTIAGSGNNTVNGGDGDDGIYISGNGSNTLSMGAGNDLVVIDGHGNNAISTGTGADSVTINGNGNNTVYTNGGNDTIVFHGSGTNLIDPPPPTLSVNSVQQVEGDGTTTLTFTVTLSAPSAFPVTVNYATQDGSATAGEDYAAALGTLTFAPGETSKTVTVTILGDTTVEADETFTLALSGADAGAATGTATLLNDDATVVSVSSVQQVEGNSTNTLTFTITLSNPSAFPVTVNFATADGTALAGSDYVATYGTLTFAPGETSQTVTVTILGDATVESDETFTLVLSDASGATIGAATGTATLLNDDVLLPPPPPPVDQHDNGNHNGFVNGPHYGYPDDQVSASWVKPGSKNQNGRH